MNVLAIDQGTSATKAIVTAADGSPLAVVEVPVHPVAGPDGAVEQDPEELWQSVVEAGTRALAEAAVAVDAVVAAGNLLHGAETAVVCARSGAWAGRAIVAWLRDDRARWLAVVPLETDGALQWVSPNAAVAGRADVPHGHLLARSTTFARRAVLSITQGDRLLTEAVLRRLVPNRSLHLPADWLAGVEPGVPVRLRLDLPA